MLGEICNDYLSKGRHVYIEGKIQTRSWETEGTKHYITEIVANDMQMLDPKNSSANDHDSSQNSEKAYKETETELSETSIDDDIPF